MEGSYSIPTGGALDNDQGIAPAGWPTGQGTIGNVQPNQGAAAAPPPEQQQGVPTQALPNTQKQPASPFQKQ